MKIKLPLLLITSYLCVNTYAQNLVVNPSFENTASNCGNSGGETFFDDLTATWDAANSNAQGDSCTTPDLFSECNDGPSLPPPFPPATGLTDVPNSQLGFQYAHSGTRYGGIILRDRISEYREYLQGRLSAPLIGGQLYSVSMYVSRADDVPYASNNMGVYFSTTHYNRDACPGEDNSGIYLTPHLNYSQVITDTSAAWFLLEWDYVATGGEQYFLIGNFFNNAGTDVDTIPATGFNYFAYYFIDDVSVQAVDCSANFTLTPDPNQQHYWYAVSQATGTAPFNYEWSWGDGTTSTGQTPTHVYDSAGYYNICLTVTDNNGCSNIYCDASNYIYKTEQTMVTVNCVLQLPTGINEESMNRFTVYPNPASDQLFIETNGASITGIRIYNTTGNLVISSNQLPAKSLDISKLPAGVYVAEITGKEGSVKKGG